MLGMCAVNPVAKIYSLPDCHKCEELKAYLKGREIPFEAKWFDSEAQTEFVMRNMFGNPPILEVGERCAASEEMFPGGVLSVDVVGEFLNVKEG
jgi:glutaredoxin